MTRALVIFVLSLSLCLCQAVPTVKQEASSANASSANANPAITQEVTPAKPENVTEAIVTNSSTTLKPTPSVTVDDKNKTAGNTSEIPTKAPATVATTTDKNATTTEKTTTQAISPNTTTLAPATTTTAKTTDAPHVTEKPVHTARAFDSPSFFGGIILTLGLLAIGFMGFKYYKNQTERNYHTL